MTNPIKKTINDQGIDRAVTMQHVALDLISLPEPEVFTWWQTASAQERKYMEQCLELLDKILDQQLLENFDHRLSRPH